VSTRAEEYAANVEKLRELRNALRHIARETSAGRALNAEELRDLAVSTHVLLIAFERTAP
jgi:hypothetical protein